MPRSAIIWTRSRELSLNARYHLMHKTIISWSKCRPLKRSCAEMGSVICGHYRPAPTFSSVCTRTRESAFPIVLGSLAHHRWLRGDPYDPQRPGALECGGCEGRSAPSLYCWYVWIGSLIHSVIAPTSRSIPKLQHYRTQDLLQTGTSITQRA